MIVGLYIAVVVFQYGTRRNGNGKALFGIRSGENVISLETSRMKKSYEGGRIEE